MPKRDGPRPDSIGAFEMAETLSLFKDGGAALVPGPVFLAFELKGKPGHKGRHRSRIVIPKEAWCYSPRGRFLTDAGTKRIFMHQYPDPETEAYEKTLAEAAELFMRGRLPSENPLALLVHVYKPIPESWSKRDKAAAIDGLIMPTSRPDGDNYLKVAMDGLNQIVWRDDAQVVDARVIKKFSDSPALRIEVREFISPRG